ncbi:MAG: hypothetical protein OJF48_004343 [Afipia sp.]|nr:MAG: hypothetical protein OJF48_004343 [Afipia sp.]
MVLRGRRESHRPSLRGAKRRSNPLFACLKLDCFASLAMTMTRKRYDADD